MRIIHNGKEIEGTPKEIVELLKMLETPVSTKMDVSSQLHKIINVPSRREVSDNYPTTKDFIALLTATPELQTKKFGAVMDAIGKHIPLSQTTERNRVYKRFTAAKEAFEK